MPAERTRERWLQLARDLVLRDVFAPADLAPPHVPNVEDGEQTDVAVPIAVTCGWPTRGALSRVRRVVGQCSPPILSEAGRYEVNVSPYVAEPVEVLAVLVHELAHVVAGVKAQHKGRFVTVIRAVGLEGKPTATTPGEQLLVTLDAMADRLGSYPHSRLNGETSRKQGTRLHKVTCADCGYVVRVTRVWLAVGLPTCPCGCLMAIEEQAAAGEKGEKVAA